MEENFELESIRSINIANQNRMNTAIIYGILLWREQGKINKMRDKLTTDRNGNFPVVY